MEKEKKKKEEEKTPPNWFSVEKNIMFAPYISNSHKAYENQFREIIQKIYDFSILVDEADFNTIYGP